MSAANSQMPPTPTRHSGLCLPADKTIAVSVISGPLKGLTHRLTKPQISIGHAGSGADIEIDDPSVSNFHCAVGVSGDIVRLCDLDSKTGTFVDEKNIQAAELRHLSEFRVGPSVFLVIIRSA